MPLFRNVNHDITPDLDVQVNWGNPIARYLEFLFLGKYPEQNIALPQEIPNVNDLTKVATPKGVGIKFNSGGSYINWPNPPFADFLGLQDFTRSMTIYWDTDMSSANAMLSNSDLRADFAIGSPGGVAAGVVGFQYYDGAFKSLSWGTAPLRVVTQLDFVKRQGVGHYLYANGRLVASDTNTSDIQYASTRDRGFGRRTTPSPVSSAQFTLLRAEVYNKALTAAEILDKYRNPGQLIEPIQRSFINSAASNPTASVPNGNLNLTAGAPKQTMLQIHKVPAHGT